MTCLVAERRLEIFQHEAHLNQCKNMCILQNTFCYKSKQEVEKKYSSRNVRLDFVEMNYEHVLYLSVYFPHGSRSREVCL